MLRSLTIPDILAMPAEWHKVRCWFVAAAIICGTTNAVLLIGPGAVNPSNTQWLEGDPATHYLGWAFLRDDPNWQFPPTFTTRIGYPRGISISFTDSIPLVAVSLRPFTSILPEPFQYLGLYACLLMVLQAYFGFRLCHMVCDKRLGFAALGGLLFLLSPVVTLRTTGHYALASHWLILAGLVLYFRFDCHARKVTGLWPGFLITGLGGAVNPYIGVMTLFTLLATVFRLLWERRVSVFRAAGCAALGVVTLGASLYMFGFLASGSVSDYGTGGYGHYSMNLLGPINPGPYGSILLPSIALAAGGNQFEGYNYLGAGVVLLLALGLAKHPGLFRGLLSRRLLAALCLAVISTVLAVSPAIDVGPVTIVEFDYPGVLENLLSALRGSGRLFWPAYYLIFLAAVVVTYRVWGSRRGTLILMVMLVFQCLDVAQLRNMVRDKYGPPAESALQAKAWQALGDHHSTLMVIPPWQCGPAVTPGGLDGYRIFGMLAAAQDMNLNSYYAGRTFAADRRLHCATIVREVSRGVLDTDTAYVVSDRVLVDIGLSGSKSHTCDRVDGFNLCTNAPGGSGKLAGWRDLLPRLDRGRADINDKLKTMFVRGWTAIEGDGAWTIAVPARLAFRVSESLTHESLRVTLRFQALLVDGRQGYTIKYNDQVVAKDSVTAIPGTRTASIAASFDLRPVENGVIVLDVLPDSLASPASQGVNEDTRRIGLYLTTVELESL